MTERGGNPRFCFTLDTEPDDLWAQGSRLQFEHFEHLFQFHRDLVAHGARPTYLTTSEVAENLSAARCMSRILEYGSAELGAHFHTWTRQWPFDVPDLGTPPIHAMAHQLGATLEQRMLRFTCDVLEREFRIRPVSYRGGRWSLNGDSIESLRQCGILVDSTVTPGINWSEPGPRLLSGPDFRDFPQTPFYLSSGSLQPDPRKGDVLELPVGASFVPNRAVALDRGLCSRLRRKLWSSVRRPYGVLWLRPTLFTNAELRKCLKMLAQSGVRVWVAMIHSSEIIHCKHLPTDEQVERFRRRCIELVKQAMDLGAIGATLGEVQAYHAQRA